ncbi:MAG: serpin family protein [Bacteroidaceae bacterium]|nr:serpin family protein [Bacteroidaceae bacterium]
MKKLLLISALCAGLCSSCSNNDEPLNIPPIEPTFELVELDTRTQEEIAKNGNVFANKLMLQMNQQVTDQNMMISPMSLQYALGMLSNGCDEAALKEITDAMGMNDYSLDMLNSFYYNLTQTLAKKDKDFTLKLANAIWIQNDYQVGQNFIQNNKALFNADVRNINFEQADKAKKTINEWASKATEGTIKELSLQINNMTRVVLANACYLKGKWTLPFNKKDTKKETFYNLDGSTSEANMMYLTETLNFRDSSSEPYMAVELPYGNQTLSMLVILPKENKTLDDIIPTINWSKMHLGGRKVHVQLPKFKIEANYPDEIMKCVKEMGINRIFIPGSLSGINDELFVSFIAQDTFIEVDEAGTEASAVTTIGMAGAAGPESTPPPTPTIRMDRPFAFAICENTTGAVLFMGKVVKI